MTQYMVAIHHPDDFVPGSEGQAAMDDITALNKEMVAKGVRVFVGGMAPVSEGVGSYEVAGEHRRHRRSVYGIEGTHRRLLGA